MKSIETEITNTIIIQKSKFICRLLPIFDLTQIKEQLKKIKEEFPNATHYCFAYILNQEKKCSDDGEPNGTAGLPILNVLEKKGIHYVLCIVIRYFGGIKLGAGGLIRAYSNAVIEALKDKKIVDLEKGVEITCIFPYSNEKQIQYLLQNTEIIKKEYKEMITYQVKLAYFLFQELQNSLEKIASISIKNFTYIKKSLS